MPKYVLVHGGLKVGEKLDARHAEVGDVVELTEAQAKDVDPQGRKLMSLPEWEAAKKQAAAQAELEAERKKSGNTKPLPPKLSAAIDAEKKKLQAAAAKAEPEKLPAAPVKK